MSRVVCSAQLALLTSFCVDGLDRFMDANKGWPFPPSLGIEFYAAMRGDVDWLFSSPADHSALAVMGGPDPRVVAHRLLQRFKGRRIVAISTFLPEIMNEGNPAMPEDLPAVRALIFLVRMIRVLQSEGQPVRTLELVGGTSGHAPEIDRHSGPVPRYYIGLREEDDAFEHFLAMLQPVAEETGGLVDLACEMEPGPLFNFRDLPSLQRFCRRIDSSGTPEVQACVGLNLDIPHWAFLGSKVKSEDLARAEYASVRRRIVHAHISDHSKGHFCDKAPLWTDVDRRREFEDWLRLVRDLYAEPRAGRLRPSGYVSVELECCDSLETVQEAVKYFAERMAASRT